MANKGKRSIPTFAEKGGGIAQLGLRYRREEPVDSVRPKLAVTAGELPMGCWASRLHQNARGDRPGQPPGEKLVLKEFYTPDEHASIEASGWKWPETRRLCVLCTRAATHEMFIQARSSSKQIPSDVRFARVSNIVDLPGEYLATDCFVSAQDRFEGVIDPVVIPRLVDYGVCTMNGVRQVIQKPGYPGRVLGDWTWPRPTDFRH